MPRAIPFLLATLLAAGGAQAQVAEPDPSLAPSGTYVLDDEHASITFRVPHYGLSRYTARLTDFDATLLWNAEDPAGSSLAVEVDPTSVDTDFGGAEDFDAKVSNDFLGAGEHPQIRFTSTAVERTGETTGRVTGDLDFHGTTLPVVLDVTFNGAFESGPVFERPQLGFSAAATIDRTRFGSDHLLPHVGSEVDILIEVEFVREAEGG